MEQTNKPVRNDVAMAATILVLALLLAVAGLILVDRWHSAAGRLQEPTFEDLLGVIATAAGLAIGAWWIATFLLAMAAALLRQAGKDRCASATAKLSPAFMVRLAGAILGLSLVGIPLANASPAQSEPAWSPANGSTPSGGISAQWTPSSSPSPHLPVVPSLESSSSEIDPHWQPRAPVAEPGLLGPGPQRAAEQPASPNQGEVVVKRGDSLWSIATRQLGPMASDVDVALHWPKWYAANRHVIGNDPGFLVPGQILQPPPN
ncbi:LysM peptidoglycan-binding domain-containing protein [Arthrobacter sp. FW306-2-2C-D06B]|uniref:LysM peptidoglycan-binding domain-containing protein n=1 Tax=Arthrobacter sp. FW306-2-2C-D06B TaxID=2879618 RepID=UPI001F26D455|nr:LysM domain-containing protein [Arthrobacter sp. FW306-2-2C-D06B]UKA57544.1 LysM peptidoglycan-binding domain-containing protein [Arthrobacter sp. FW306-2-2C-D06B]